MKKFIVIIWLIFLFLGALFSVKDDSLTMDELAHLPAGFSYLTQKDMRLNPEHPPLIKDLAAFPLLFFKNIKFPSQIKDWQEDINGQWGFGNNFLFKVSNPADLMILAGRIPMILLLVFLGFFIFQIAKEFYGMKVAFLSLFFFSFSPTFLAHGRLVTTDVGASAGVVLATFFFLKALKNPSFKNIIWAGLFFGLAELVKFSLILLIPYFLILGFFWWIFKMGNLKQIILTLFFVFLLGYFLVYFFYVFHTYNLPAPRQFRDEKFLLSSNPFKIVSEGIPEMTKNKFLKPLSWYLTGLAMATQRAAGGHTGFFLGQVTAAGWKNYFPVVYLIKEPLPFHIFTAVAILYFAIKIEKPFWKNPILRFKNWSRNHFKEFSFLLFIFIYWATSLTSNLNIGVRHLLPVFPFTFILVSKQISDFLQSDFLKKLKLILIFFLISWQAISVISVFPHFLAYFNELVGGPNKGYLYVVNSNLDWGQDLKRLKKWIEKNKIEKIYIDYFGGADVEYYLGNKALLWESQKDFRQFEKGNFLAVSATFLQGGIGLPAKGFEQKTGYYRWLWQYENVAKIGYSIFIFYIK